MYPRGWGASRVNCRGGGNNDYSNCTPVVEKSFSWTRLLKNNLSFYVLVKTK